MTAPASAATDVRLIRCPRCRKPVTLLEDDPHLDFGLAGGIVEQHEARLPVMTPSPNGGRGVMLGALRLCAGSGMRIGD